MQPSQGAVPVDFFGQNIVELLSSHAERMDVMDGELFEWHGTLADLVAPFELLQPKTSHYLLQASARSDQ